MNPQNSAVQTVALEAPHETPFYISATRIAAGAPRTLKCGDTFIVIDSRGDIAAASGRSAGLFHHDTRYLSRLELFINDTPPLLLGSNLRDDNSALFVDLTNPDIISEQHIVLEKDSVHILRTVFLWRGTAYQRLRLQNYGDRAVDLRLSIVFENDFDRRPGYRAGHPGEPARGHRRGTARHFAVSPLGAG